MKTWSEVPVMHHPSIRMARHALLVFAIEFALTFDPEATAFHVDISRFNPTEAKDDLRLRAIVETVQSEEHT